MSNEIVEDDDTQSVGAEIHCTARVADEIRSRLMDAVVEILEDYDDTPDVGDIIDWGVG